MRLSDSGKSHVSFCPSPANTCYGSPECDGELISVGAGLESCCLTDGAYSFHNGSQCFVCNGASTLVADRAMCV